MRSTWLGINIGLLVHANGQTSAMSLVKQCTVRQIHVGGAAWLKYSSGGQRHEERFIDTLVG